MFNFSSYTINEENLIKFSKYIKVLVSNGYDLIDTRNHVNNIHTLVGFLFQRYDEKVYIYTDGEYVITDAINHAATVSLLNPSE